ncbi:porin [Paraburkholderia bannensis]|uniref:porin n=1 Tax=Paraburkholderia bannensis TaxID=765414 RepID=UPI002AC3608B|nr:porin [Paraburkholderia bannensis]
MFRQDSRRHYPLSHAMLVAGALAGYAGAAHAQAMYTIGGFLDESVTAYRDSNGARLVQMQDSAIFPTKIFFRGTDDLGGGLSANFSLDSMIGLSNGSLSPQSHGALFENSAWVGLRQSSLGSIRMGQQNDFSFDYFLIGGIDPATGIAGGMLNFRTGSFGADLLGVKGPAQIGAAITGGPYAPIITNGVPTGLGAINWDRVGGTRMSNAVKVVSDEYAGFSIGAMYSFGGVAGDFSNESGKSAVLSYRAHETHAAVVYTEQNYSAIDGGHGGIANLLAGVRTRISDFKLSAMYSQARNTYTGARIYALATGVGYDFTFDWYLGAAYTYSNGNSQLKNVTVNQAALQLTHALSKLTSIYLTGVFQRTNGAYAAEIGNTVASGNIQSVVALGMLVRF